MKQIGKHGYGSQALVTGASSGCSSRCQRT